MFYNRLAENNPHPRIKLVLFTFYQTVDHMTLISLLISLLSHSSVLKSNLNSHFKCWSSWSSEEHFILLLHNPSLDLPAGSSLGSCSGLCIGFYFIMNSSLYDSYFGYSRYDSFFGSYVAPRSSLFVIPQVSYNTTQILVVQHVLF